MPLVGFLLQSDDLKKQSDRIVQEIKLSNDAQKFADQLTTTISNSDLVKANLQFQKEQQKIIHGIKASVDNLQTTIDNFIKSNSLPRNLYSSEKEEKKSTKK